MRQWPQFWQQLKIDGLDYSCKEYYLQLSFFAFFFQLENREVPDARGKCVGEKFSRKFNVMLSKVRGVTNEKINDRAKVAT